MGDWITLKPTPITYQQVRSRINTIIRNVIDRKTAIASSGTSEITHYMDNDGNIHTQTTGRGAMSGADPAAQFAVESIIGGKILGDLAKGAIWGVGKYGSKVGMPWLQQKARNYIVGHELKNAIKPTLIPKSKISTKKHIKDPDWWYDYYSQPEHAYYRDVGVAKKRINDLFDSREWKKRMLKYGFSEQEIPKVRQVLRDLTEKDIGNIPKLEIQWRWKPSGALGEYSQGATENGFVNRLIDIDPKLSGTKFQSVLTHELAHATTLADSRELLDGVISRMYPNVQKVYGKDYADAFSKYLRKQANVMQDVLNDAAKDPSPSKTTQAILSSPYWSDVDEMRAFGIQNLLSEQGMFPKTNNIAKDYYEGLIDKISGAVITAPLAAPVITNDNNGK